MKIGVLAFGGGYASMPLVEQQVVNVKHWMTYSEFMDIVAIDELTPGPVAINAATFVGNKMAGIPGAIFATMGTILPPLIITLIFARLYFKYREMKVVNGALSGLRAMVVGLIASTSLSILMNAIFGSKSLPITSVDWLSVALFVAALTAYRILKDKTNPVFVLLGCGFISLILCTLFNI